MLQMMRDLIAHKGHANMALLDVVRTHPEAAADPDVLGLLHHNLVANRFWFLTICGTRFDHARETVPPASLEILAERFASTQRDEEAWIANAEAEDLERLLESELIPGRRCTVAQGLMQVCLHSQGHRAQVAKMLRRHGGTPPMTDFILWLRDRTR